MKEGITTMQPFATKLWNRNFNLLIIGQIISLFGNMIISFALPLYIFSISDSPALFGLVMGLPYISLLLLSPIGGIIADRLRKQRIMFWLDASTTALILLYMVVSGLTAYIVPIVIVKLLALNAIQGMYIPTVQASVPLLVPGEKLTSGNAIVGVVNSLSGMVGMAVAGFVFGRFGLTPILIIGAICFAITAIMDLLIRMPYKKRDSSGGVLKIVKEDLTQSVRYATKEKPILAKVVIIVFFMVLMLASVIMVGQPVLVYQYLDMGMEHVGISQSLMMIGAVIGGIIAGTMGEKLTIKKSFIVIAIGSIFILLKGIIFLVGTPYFTAYIVVTATCAIVLMTVQIFNVAAITFVQKNTPSEIVGKVLSIIMVLPFLAQAIGQVLYGALFEGFYSMPWIVIIATAVMVAAIAIFSQFINWKSGNETADISTQQTSSMQA
ncbi:MAG: MFS transporter [Oscillospiraceae bacterium]|nr:MFS transporter [Oscillospiraceae bacterium]